MCRLFAWHATAPVTLRAALGPDAPSLAELSRVHADGWGMSYGSGTQLLRVRDVTAAHESPMFEQAMDGFATCDAIVHLRMATGGLQVCDVNTHPFVKDTAHGQVAFCHNGGIQQGPDLDALIDADLAAGLDGTTDSEQYFAALLTAMRRTDGDVVAAFRRVLKSLSALHYSSLNALVLTHTDVFVLCWNIPANRPTGMDEDYYELQWDDVDGVVSAWSSGVRTRSGTPLANGDLLQISRATGEVTVHTVRQ